jgi:transposase
MVMDNAKETTGGNTEFVRTARHYDILCQFTEPHTPWQNPAERVIGELKRKWKHRAVVPRRLWDYGIRDQEAGRRLRPESSTGFIASGDAYPPGCRYTLP